RLQGVPLAWSQSFLSGWTVTGGDLQGEFVGSAGPDGLVLKPKSPLTISKLSVAQGKKPFLNDVDLSLTASADYTPQGWQAVVSSFTAKNGAATLLTLEGKAGQLAGKDRPVKATGKLAVNVPTVLAQPVAEGLMQFTGGGATIEFSTSIGLKQEFQAKLGVQDLTVDPKLSPEKLPAISADLRADREANGKISLSLPVLMERAGRKSDLSITGSIMPEKAGYIIDAHVGSERLVIDDIKILIVPFGSAEEAATRGKNPPRDTVPVWQGLSGKLTLALKRIIYSEEFQVADVTGTLRIDAGAVKLETVRAGMREGGEMKLSGALRFDSKVMEPYSLAAQFALENFDSLPLFRAFDPSKPATVEGKFNVASQLTGTGANLSALAAQTKGDVQLISRSGIFRGLRSDTGEAVKAAPSTLSGIVTGIGSLLGKDIAEKAEKLGTDINKRGKGISDIAAALAEIPYDQLSVSLVRDASLNVELKDFTLISPEVRLGGTGIVAYQPDMPFLTQTLDLQLQLGVRGKLAEQVKRASLLGEAQDSLGYVAFAFPVRVGGSLSNPDVSDLKRELVKAAASLIGR
ncbi:MAG: AsmA family protein, partial [Opitutaceae bacterium]